MVKKVKVGLSIGSIAALAGLWWGLQDEPLQKAVCQQVPEAWDVPTEVCDPAYRPIPVDVATEEIDRFLRSASGADPTGAFTRLSIEMKLEHDQFVEGWRPILWADRLTPLQRAPGQLNVFTVSYVTYDGEGADVAPRAGDVNTYSQTVGLTNVAGQYDVTRYDPPDRLDGTRVKFYREVPGRWIKTYDHPDRDGVAAPGVEPDQQLSLLCQLADGDGRWWSRTGWGWVAHSDLVHGDGSRPDTPPCGLQNLR